MTNQNLKLKLPVVGKTGKNVSVSKLKQKTGSLVYALFRTVFLVSVSYIILYPLFAMISYSFSSRADLMDTSVIWIPRSPDFENFKSAFKAMNYLGSLFQTLLVGLVSAFLEIFSCAIAAYGFARFKFKERGALFGLVLLTAIVPVQVIGIPLFINYRYFDVLGILGLIEKISGVYLKPDIINSPLTFYLPSLFGVGLRSGLFIFIYRQFFLGLPKELEEASWIDGAGPLKTFFRVVIPSSGVVILTVSIFSIIWHWNEYFLSVLFFKTNFPLAVSLSNIISELHNMGIRQEMAAGSVSAACLMFIAPMLIMFVFLQKKFIQSIDRVGIVG